MAHRNRFKDDNEFWEFVNKWLNEDDAEEIFEIMQGRSFKEQHQEAEALIDILFRKLDFRRFVAIMYYIMIQVEMRAKGVVNYEEYLESKKKSN